MPRTFQSPYPWRRVPRLSMRVRYGQSEAAHQELDVLLDEFETEHDKAFAPCKLRCAMTMSHLLRGARLGGAPSDLILRLMMQAVDTLARKRSWAGARKLMHAFIDDLMDQVRPRQQSVIVRLVARIQRDLLQQPHEAQKLKAYASAAGIHPDRLSRLFHQITGMTFHDMRRQGRVRRAQHRLVASHATVAQIAMELGIADPARFIRDFKREMGQTPGKYRAGQKK